MAKSEKSKDTAKSEKSKDTDGTAHRELSRSPKKSSDFTPVRTGTAREKVIRMGIKGSTIENIASAIERPRSSVMVHLHCLHRDNGIGYTVSGEKVHVTLPEGKTLHDVFVKKEPKKTTASEDGGSSTEPPTESTEAAEGNNEEEKKVVEEPVV